MAQYHTSTQSRVLVYWVLLRSHHANRREESPSGLNGLVLSDTVLVEALAAVITEDDVFDPSIELIEAYGTTGGDVFPMLLEAGFEVGGRAADEIFVEGIAASEVGNIEANRFAAETIKC